MKLRHAMLTAAAAGALAASLSGSAHAATVTQLIHFDDANNGKKIYTTADGNFTFDPVNMDSAGLCATATIGQNGSCVSEQKNGALTTLKRNLDTKAAALAYNNKSTETVDRNPMDKTSFTLDSFYMLFTGKGSDPNFFEVGAYDAGGNLIGSKQKYQLNFSYSNVSYFDTGLSTGADKLTFNKGYVFDMTGIAAFQGTNVASVKWSASSSAQLRMDCVVTSFDGTTSEPLSSFSRGCGISDDDGGSGLEPVPVPASLPLLLGALGLTGYIARRRKAA